MGSRNGRRARSRKTAVLQKADDDAMDISETPPSAPNLRGHRQHAFPSAASAPRAKRRKIGDRVRPVFSSTPHETSTLVNRMKELIKIAGKSGIDSARLKDIIAREWNGMDDAMYAEALTVMREDAAISHDTDTYNGVRRETWTMKKRVRPFRIVDELRADQEFLRRFAKKAQNRMQWHNVEKLRNSAHRACMTANELFAYLCYVAALSRRNVAVVSPEFFVTLSHEAQTKKDKIRAFDTACMRDDKFEIVLLPVIALNGQNAEDVGHWIFALYERSSGVTHLYDSLAQGDDEEGLLYDSSVRRTIARAIESLLAEGMASLPVPQFAPRPHVAYKKQEDVVSCGFFVILYAELFLLRGIDRTKLRKLDVDIACIELLQDQVPDYVPPVPWKRRVSETRARTRKTRKKKLKNRRFVLGHRRNGRRISRAQQPKRTSSTEDVLMEDQDTVSRDRFIGEKSVEMLLSELDSLNTQNSAAAGLVTGFKDIHDMVQKELHLFVRKPSWTKKTKLMNRWDASDVKQWTAWLLKKKESAKSYMDTNLAEAVAVMMRANFLFNGQTPRAAQALALLALYRKKPEGGRLVQVETGEGKSTICAMLAVLLALRGEVVDIVTSSSLLAQRDAKERAPFYAMFGLSVAHNTGRTTANRPKECYRKNIVYGDTLSFASDHIVEMLRGTGVRCGRKVGCMIVDEVDSMFIDDKRKSTVLNIHVPGMEYLVPLQVAIWNCLIGLRGSTHYSARDNCNVLVDGPFTYEGGELVLLEDEAGNKATAYPLGREPWKVYEALLIEHAKKCIGTADKHGAIIIPAHLRGFAESQIPKWAQSALMAQILQEDVDYIVRAHTTGARKKGDREEKFSNSSVIAPVDNTNTGIVQDNMHFSSGSQQFLQLKHSVTLRPEQIATSHMSNKALFLLAGANIYGMTGTIGSESAKEFLRDQYKVDFLEIPTFMSKQLRFPTTDSAGRR